MKTVIITVIENSTPIESPEFIVNQDSDGNWIEPSEMIAWVVEHVGNRPNDRQ